MPEREGQAGPCRHYVVIAREADIAAIIRRGLSKWWLIMCWNLSTIELEPGAWLSKRCTRTEPARYRLGNYCARLRSKIIGTPISLFLR